MVQRVWARRLLAAAAMGAVWPTAGLGADVEVTSDTTTGLQLGAAGGTAEIAAGVTVTNGFATTVVTQDTPATGAWTLTNRGTVTSDFADDIDLPAVGSGVVNAGTIDGTFNNAITLANGGSVDNQAGATIQADFSAIAIAPDTHAGVGTVSNAGTITQSVSGSGDTVALYGGGTVTNLSTGVIEGHNGTNAVSISGGTSARVENWGSISDSGGTYSTGVDVATAASSTVINHAGASITGAYNGIWAPGAAAITNDGNVSSTAAAAGAYAIEQDGGGTLTNSGTVSANSATAVRFGHDGTLTNSGTITGATNAISFGNGYNHTLELETGSVLNGNVVGGTGAGTDWLILEGSGTESLTKFSNFEIFSMQGTAWTLTGDGTFSTSGDAESGVLTLDGTLTTPGFSIHPAGTLTGTGTLVAAGGVGNDGTIRVAAGDTFHIDGALTEGAGSTFAVGVTPASNGVLAVTGDAELGGGTLSVLAGGGVYAAGSSYTILTAGSVNDTFGTLTISSPFLTPSVVYNPTSVVLTLDRSLVSFASAGRTPNEIATGAALDTLPGTDPLVAPLAARGSAEAAAAFDQLSGEIYASAQGALANESRAPRDAALDAVDGAFAALDALKAKRQHYWVRGSGGVGVLAGDGNAAALDDATGGLLAGLDTVIGNDIPMTVFGGLSTSHFDVPDRSSSATVQTFHLGAAAGSRFGNWRLSGGAIGSLATIGIERMPRFAGFSDEDRSSYGEAMGQLFGELSYAFDLGRGTLSPFGRLALVGVSGGTYSERGGDAALSGKSNGYGLALVSLGLDGDADFRLGDDMIVRARGRVGLEQAIGGAPTATSRFAGGDAFTISGAPQSGTTLLLETGLAMDLAPTASLSLGLSGTLGTRGSAAAMRATVSGTF